MHSLLLGELVGDCVFADIVYLGVVGIGEELLVTQDQLLGE